MLVVKRNKIGTVRVRLEAGNYLELNKGNNFKGHCDDKYYERIKKINTVLIVDDIDIKQIREANNKLSKENRLLKDENKKLTTQKELFQEEARDLALENEKLNNLLNVERIKKVQKKTVKKGDK